MRDVRYALRSLHFDHIYVSLIETILNLLLLVESILIKLHLQTHVSELLLFQRVEVHVVILLIFGVGSLSGNSIVGILLLVIVVISHRVLYIVIVGRLFLGEFVLLLIVIIHDGRIIQFSLLVLVCAVCCGAHAVDIPEEVVLLVLV